MLGAQLQPGGGVRFSVWAPRARKLAVRIVGGADVAMTKSGDVWSAVVPSATAGTRYSYLIDQAARPDPRSRFQPDGVHGPSQVIDPDAFQWRHPAPARALADYVIYELHVGTFTAEGTFAAAARAMPELAELGTSAIEIMPVAAFPGARNWGYDGVHLFAPNAAYGTPDELRALVDAAHAAGLSVILDVVYNHLGPEGNYVSVFAPYFTSARHTPWGDAIDYERREVREWLVDNAKSWIAEYHADALRLDAIHAIEDPSPRHICADLCTAIRTAGAIPIAETDMNRIKVLRDWGFAAAWSDDFHHALHACLTGERQGYYRDFGSPEILARTIADGWVRGPEPLRSRELPGEAFVVASQNHDQIGNRARGERLEHLVGAAGAKLAAVATLIAAPAVPLLFAGEEFAASAPFQYFTSHGDPQLARAVSEGRRREFAGLGFAWPDAIPDPQDEATFLRSKLDHTEAAREPHAAMRRLYGDLLRIRREHAALGARGKDRCRAVMREGAVWVERDGAVLVVLNVGRERTVRAPEEWTPLLHTEDRRYGGALDGPRREVPPRAAVILIKESPRR
jgi:maltooligosyltrehalose trehalohydrolase